MLLPLVIRNRIFIDYHFNLISVKDLSIHRDDPVYVQQIFSTTFYTRLFLTGIAIIIFLLILVFYPILRQHILLVLFSLPILFSQLLLNNWFFQGTEKLLQLAVLNVISKGLYIGSIFLLVKNTADNYLPNFLLGLSGTLAGIIGIILLRKQFGLHFIFPGIEKIREQVRAGFSVFLSNTSVIIYTNSAIFILGIFIAPVILGQYGVTDKIISILRAIMAVFFICKSQPSLSHSFSQRCIIN